MGRHITLVITVPPGEALRHHTLNNVARGQLERISEYTDEDKWTGMFSGKLHCRLGAPNHQSISIYDCKAILKTAIAARVYVNLVIVNT